MSIPVVWCAFAEVWNWKFAERVHSLLLPVAGVNEIVVAFNPGEAILKDPSEMLMG